MLFVRVIFILLAFLSHAVFARQEAIANGNAKTAIETYVSEINKVNSNFKAQFKKISESKNASEFDENYHLLQNLITSPGNNIYTKYAICNTLEHLSDSELIYIESLIDSRDTDISLRACKDKLLQRLDFRTNIHTTAFNLSDDINNIRQIKFEEREIPSLDYISSQGFKEKEIMLTFDDGPTKKTTLPILAALRKAGVKAAFFSTGRQAMNNPDIAKLIVNEGHVIGSHTFYHTLMMGLNVNKGKMSYDYFLSELISGHLGVYNSSQHIEPYFRFPNGCMNKNMRKNVSEIGLTIFGWNVDSFDWQFAPSKYADDDKRRELILESFVKNLKEGQNRGVVLMHDVFRQSAESLPLILNYLADNDFKVVLLRPKKQDQNSDDIPLISQAQEFMETNDIKFSEIIPPAVNGNPVPTADYKLNFEFTEMFPQVTNYDQEINSQAKTCE